METRALASKLCPVLKAYHARHLGHMATETISMQLCADVSIMMSISQVQRHTHAIIITALGAYRNTWGPPRLTTAEARRHFNDYLGRHLRCEIPNVTLQGDEAGREAIHRLLKLVVPL